MWFWYLMLFVVVATILGAIYKSIASKNEKKRLLKLIESDERLKDAKLYDASTGYFIAIAESGYIALKTIDLQEAKILHYNDINGFEIRKDGHSSSANTGQAALGGLLFGGVGAVIGGIGSSKEKINTLSLIFKINDFNMPSIEIKFIEELDSLKTDSFIYKDIMKRINEIDARLSYIEKKYKQNN